MYFLFALLIGTANATTLSDIYHAALNTSSIVKNKRLAEERGEALKSQSYSEVLPTLEISSDNDFKDEIGGSSVSSTFGEDYQHTSKLTLKQPLFQGGAGYHGLRIAKTLPKVAHQDLRQAEIDLYNGLAEIFYEILSVRNDLTTLDEQAKILRKREVFLRKRAKIGRNKPSDVLVAQSQLARVNANLSSVKSDLIRKEQELIALTGFKSVGPLKDNLKLKDLSVSPTWEKNLALNPMVKAQELVLEQAKASVDVAKSGYLPKVDLTGNYYLDRAGILEDSKWDLSVVASWELYSGGYDRAENKIKNIEALQVNSELEDLKRSLNGQYEAQKSEFLIKKEVVVKLDVAESFAKKSYQEHVKEFNRGLVSNLDVLKALDDYLQVKRERDRTEYVAKLAWIRLKGLAGIRP